MQAEALLPLWVHFGPWLWGPLYGLISAPALELMLRNARLPAPEPWNERARAVYPLRLLANMARVLAVAGAIVFLIFAAPGGGHLARDLWTVAAPFFITLWPALRFENRLVPALPAERLRSLLTRWSLVSAIIPVIAGPMLLGRVPPDWKPAVAAVSTALVLLSVLGAGLWLTQALGLAREAGPRVRAAVERAAARLNVRPRSVLEADWLAANAFAFPLTRAVVFTMPMEALMTDDELEAVAAHELGHLSEPWRVKLSRPLATVLLYAALSVFLWRGDYSVNAVAVLLVVVVAVLMLVARLRRAGERHADAAAHDEGKVYGRALEKLYAYNLVPAVLRRPGAHGHLYDRLVASGYTPEWPRPQPPASPALGWRVLFASFAVAPAMVAVLWQPMPESVDGALLTLALRPQSAWAYERLAREESDPQRVRAFYLAAVEADPASWFLHAAAAAALADHGVCDDAQAQLAEAERLAAQHPLAHTAQEMSAARDAFERCAR